MKLPIARRALLLAVLLSMIFGAVASPAMAHAAAVSNGGAECPVVLAAKCSFDPAAYVQNSADPSDYGNYDIANRPADGTKIRGVTVHDIEGTCQAAIDRFKDPKAYVSAHYVICADGRIVQMVRLKDIAWTAGNWWYNMHFVQIEHEGYAAKPGSYTDAMLASSAMLVRWLSQKYGFPITKATVHGHDNIPGTSDASMRTQHVDPGPFMNWQNYLAMLGVITVPRGNPMAAKMVIIAPLWPKTREVVTGCSESVATPPPCVPPGPHSTNFVYLRTGPVLSAPLLTDPILGPGSTEIENRAARAFYGTTYAVADRKAEAGGIWYKIWFGGQEAWFYSPHNAPTAFPAKGTCAKPKGDAAVPVFGRPLPEISEWRVDFTLPPGSQPVPAPLSYTAKPGQCYSVIDSNVLPDHYFSWSFDNTYPRFRVAGATPYVWVHFSGRDAFMKASDITIVS